VYPKEINQMGNSAGIVISKPKPIRNTLNFTVGDDVELLDKENRMILKSKEREER
jgi:antitoxin component of MazEF toxin-antitoxin module